MFHYSFAGHKRATSPIALKSVATVATGALVFTMLSVPPATAAQTPDDLLNVGFNGGFTSTEENAAHTYVKAEDEKIDGTLSRRSDAVSISDEHTAVFNGNYAGLTYTPTNPQLLTDASAETSKAPVNQTLRAEMIFTPENNQRAEGTLFSAAGNLYVVHLNGKLRYGYNSFDTKANPHWGKHYQEVDWPAANEQHVLQITYSPESAEKMLVALDGKALPPVTAEKQAATHDHARNLIGFGHEVHPGTINTDRGFKGSIDAVRVLPKDESVQFAFSLPNKDTSDEATPGSGEETQPPTNGGSTNTDNGATTGGTVASAEEILDLTFNGKLTNNAYTPGENETLRGQLNTKAGNESIESGKAQLPGASSGLTYTFDSEKPLSTSDDGLTLNKPFRAEILFTPTQGQQPELSTIFSAGGNLYVRYQDGQIRYGFDSFNSNRTPRWQGHTQHMPTPEGGKTHLMRVEYLPSNTGATMKVSINGTAGPDVVAENDYSRMSDAAKTTIGFGREVNPGGTSPQRGFAGSIDAVRLLPEGAEYKLVRPETPTVEDNAPTPQPPADDNTSNGNTSEENPQAAILEELLNVTFGGSLVGTNQYTTQEDDIMRGNLRGASGQETQTPSNVALGGNTQGLNFTSEGFELGTDRISKSFVMEAVFVPKGEQSDLATILAAGGNLSVRYRGGALSYGWDHNTPTEPRRWQKPSHSVTAPAAGKEHVISMHHRVTPNGTVTMDVMLDGETLQSVTSSHGANIANGRANLFAFGNDVHPVALSRGLVGDLKKVRVATTNGGETTRQIFAYQPQPNSEDLFRTSWAGQLNDTNYAKAPADIMLGSAKAHANPTISDGNLVTRNGDDALVFTPQEDALHHLQTKGFIAETTFTPDGEQTDGATIVEIGGKFFARYKNGALEYGYETENGPIVRHTPFKAEKEHVISLAYLPTEGGATVTAWLDRVALDPIVEPTTMVKGAEFGKAVFGNTIGTGDAAVFKGTMGESRYAILNGPHRPRDFQLQVLDEVCADISTIEPGNYIAVSEEDCQANIIKKAALVRPTEKQAVWQEEGLTAFIHYGINTYTRNPNNGEIGIEWGHGNVPASEFNPTGDLNPDTWVKTLRDNGYRTTILVLKHHDGFMTWPTRYSEYSIKNSPWKNGQGNILREFTDAAHKYGMKVGVYISPADSHEEERPGGTHGNKSAAVERTIPTLVDGDDREGKIPADKTFTYKVDDYDHFFLNTLYELLTEYGEVHEVWFDGAAGNTRKKEYYDYGIYFDMISKLQPGANVAVGGRDIRWIGNEHGEGRLNEWSVLPITGDPSGKIGLFQPGGPFNQNLGSDQQLIDAVRAGRGVQNLHWWPGEADMKLTGGWFAHHSRDGRNIDRPKSPQRLLNHYEETVGRNSVMLLNVPPTVEGTFTQSNVDAIAGFAAERRKAFTQDHALGLPVSIGDTTTLELTNGNVRDGVVRAADDTRPMEIDLGAPQTVTRVGISEDILDAGQVVRSFTVEALRGNEWVTVAESGVIGAQRIVKLAQPETAQKFRITVTSARAAYVISNFQLYGQLDTDPGVARDAYIDCSAPKAGVGTEQSPFNSLEQLRKHELAPGSDLYFKAGVDCADANITVWAYGTDSDKVELKSWGAGAAPTINGAPLNERFAKYAQQGWDLASAPAPEPTPDPQAKLSVSYSDGSDFTGTVKRGETLRFNISGVPAQSEIQVWVHSDPQKVAIVTAGDDGSVTADWTVTNVEDGAHTIYLRTSAGEELVSQPLAVNGEVSSTDTGGEGNGTGTDDGAGTGNGTGDTGTGDTGSGSGDGTGEKPGDNANEGSTGGNTGDDTGSGNAGAGDTGNSGTGDNTGTGNAPDTGAGDTENPGTGTPGTNTPGGDTGNSGDTHSGKDNSGNSNTGDSQQSGKKPDNMGSTSADNADKNPGDSRQSNASTGHEKDGKAQSADNANTGQTDRDTRKAKADKSGNKAVTKTGIARTGATGTGIVVLALVLSAAGAMMLHRRKS